MFLRRATPRTLPTEPVDYPPGTFVRTERGYFYIVSETRRLRILSERVLASWRPLRIVETTEAAVGDYRISAKLKFRNGSLLYSLASGKMYLIVEGKRRQVKNPDVLTRIGALMKDAVVVSQDEIEMHEIGDDLK